MVRTTIPENKKEIMIQAINNPIAVIRELNNRSLFHFLECFWGEVSNSEFKPNWHLYELCKELEEIAYLVGSNTPKDHDLIINISPGTTKTILCSIVYPVWCWTKWYWMRFITASYSLALSLESAEYSRDLIKSDKFRLIYPELSIKDDKAAKGNFKIVKKITNNTGRLNKVLKGGNRYSTSVGATITGFHGHINILDLFYNIVYRSAFKSF
jgi:hypothetical protein